MRKIKAKVTFWFYIKKDSCSVDSRWLKGCIKSKLTPFGAKNVHVILR